MIEGDQVQASQEIALATKVKLAQEGITPENFDLYKSLNIYLENREDGKQRIADFERINSRLNQLMKDPAKLPAQFRDVSMLSKDMNGDLLPSLEDVREAFEHSPSLRRVLTATLDNAVKEYPSWAQINIENPSEGTPASGALIEGFAAFIGVSSFSKMENTNYSEVSRHYVMAFEEVLLSENPESFLVDDVIGWMKAEKESFPEVLQPQINERQARTLSVNL